METGVNYGVYEHTVSRLKNHLSDPIAIPLSAATAGFFLTWIVSPAELIKCRMQLGAGDPSHSYKGSLDCIRQIVRSEGLLGLFRGATGTLAREMPGNAVYFTSYKTLRDILPGKRQNNNTNNNLDHQPRDGTIIEATSAITSGALSGMIMWATVYPIDVAKSRIQTSWPGSTRDVGLISQLRNMYREGGRRVMYAGLAPTLIRAAPANVSIEYWFLVKMAKERKKGGKNN